MMKNKKIVREKRIPIFRLLPLVVIAVAALLLLFGHRSPEKKVSIKGFVYDSCGGCFTDGIPCKPCTVVLGLEQYLAGELKALDLNLDFKVHNLLYEKERETLNTLLPDLDGEDMEYPILMVNDTVLYGWRQIQQEFHTLVLDQSGDSRADVASFTKIPNVDIQLEPGDSEVLVYFKIETCRSCKEIAEYLQEVMKEKPSAELLVYDVEEAGMLELFEAYCQLYGVNSDTATVPILFIGSTYLEGENEVRMFLEPYMEMGYGYFTYRVQ